MSEQIIILTHHDRFVARVDPRPPATWLGIAPRVALVLAGMPSVSTTLAPTVARELGAALIAAADRAEAMPDQQRQDDQEVTP
jgi:hypothetical protein